MSRRHVAQTHVCSLTNINMSRRLTGRKIQSHAIQETRSGGSSQHRLIEPRTGVWHKRTMTIAIVPSVAGLTTEPCMLMTSVWMTAVAQSLCQSLIETRSSLGKANVKSLTSCCCCASVCKPSTFRLCKLGCFVHNCVVAMCCDEACMQGRFKKLRREHVFESIAWL